MPDQPLIFSKPTHALAQAKNNLITLPGNQGAVHHEVEIVLEIDRDYEAGLSVDDLVSKMYVGLDLTLRDKQQSLKDRKSTRLNSSHVAISYAVFCLKKKIQ